jgi:vWA-MoxR associated protein C-terminal domain/vWA-MoxR associated protein middle region (VMAP-M) 8/Trypsin-like peptidase domain
MNRGTGLGWRARIDTVAGAPCGSAFLVTSNVLLTCAHVVAGLPEVLVTFPGIQNGSRLPARVIDLHCWDESSGRGDVALVELGGPAPVEPCVLSGLDVLRPRSGRTSFELRALGFPRHHDRDGIHVTLRGSDDRELSEEWLQVDVEEAHLRRLGRGFSGAAAWIAESGQVAGMITSAELDGEGGGFTGRMLPLRAIRRYWEGIDDFLPLPWLDRQSRRELRAAVGGVTVTAGLGGIFKTAFPAFLRGQDFRTPWAAIRYAAEAVPGEDSLPLFLPRLAAYLDGGARSRLTDWTRRWLPAAAAELERAHPPVTSLVITLRTPMRHGKTHLELTAGPHVGGRPVTAPQRVMVPRAQLQAKIEKVITAQVSKLPSPDWMIEFAVEPNEMSLPFEEWQFREPGDQRPRPLRLVPLVVRDVSRLDPEKKFVSNRARQRWDTLRARGETGLAPVCCKQPYDFDQFRDWLEDDADICAVAYGIPPKQDWLAAALNTGLPIMVWSRQNCSGGEAHELHEEFLSRVTADLSAADPDQLPAAVMRLRKQARSPVTGSERHHGRHLTLFWDHPARLPDPPLTEGG